MKESASKLYSLKEDVYQLFPEENHCIYRSLYDPYFSHYHKTLRTRMPELVGLGIPGYTRVDLALAAAAWTINKHMPFAYECDPEHSPQDYIPKEIRELPPDHISPEILTQYTKKASRMFGASLVGIAELDRKWLYKTKVIYSTAISKKDDTPNFPDANIPEDIKYAIVIAIEMEPEGFRCAPTFLEFASAGLGYSKMSFTIACVAQFIRNLGYTAYPCANDTALSVPLAIDAGLGALGRIGILVTKEFGPRVRLCKVLTNMPLVPDGPDVDFISEINEICRDCRKCAEVCDKNAISMEEEPGYSSFSCSNNAGVKKWYVNVEKCYEAWIENSSDCGKCIQACPFSKIGNKIDPKDFWHL